MIARRSLLAAALLSACGAPIFEAGAAPLRLHDQGAAPDFTGLAGWLNSAPLALRDLRGSVVLLEFWAFACANCIRTIPHIRGWRDQFQGRGLRVIGVHTPEFPREAIRASVEAASARWRVDYPIALDSARATWNAYRMRAWPTLVLIDRHGRIVLRHEGEGEERAIERLIAAALS